MKKLLPYIGIGIGTSDAAQAHNQQRDGDERTSTHEVEVKGGVILRSEKRSKKDIEKDWVGLLPVACMDR
jgi:hypothetical protein